MITSILIITALIVASGFFSGIEIAYFSSDKLRIELEKKKGSKLGSILSEYVEKPSIFLGTTLVGNNIVLVVFSIYAENFLIQNFGISMSNEFLQIVTLSSISTVVVLIFGEYLPKVIFRTMATGLLFFFAFPFYVIKIILSPFVWFMVQFSYGLLRILFGIKVKENEQVFTKLDLEHFLKNIKSDIVEDIDHTLFQNALYIDSVRVKDCMVPRNEIQGIEITDSINELRNKFIESQNSRIIVFENSIDEIRGYVHHQQLLKNPLSIKSIMFQIPVVHEFTSAREIMQRFIKEKLNIAWVVDEFGGTAGIVTLEDLLEQIVGDISDEYDPELQKETVSDNEYLFSGRLRIEDLNEEFNLNLPESEDYNTLSGFLTSELETIPNEGESMNWNHLEFIFESVSDTRIEIVRIRKLFEADNESIENNR